MLRPNIQSLILLLAIIQGQALFMRKCANKDKSFFFSFWTQNQPKSAVTWHTLKNPHYSVGNIIMGISLCAYINVYSIVEDINDSVKCSMWKFSKSLWLSPSSCLFVLIKETPWTKNLEKPWKWTYIVAVRVLKRVQTVSTRKCRFYKA